MNKPLEKDSNLAQKIEKIFIKIIFLSETPCYYFCALPKYFIKSIFHFPMKVFNDLINFER